MVRERDVVVECKGHDAARLCNVDHAHGWEKDIVGMLDQKHGKRKIQVAFDCETLKVDDAAEEHIRIFMPELVGMGAVVTRAFTKAYLRMLLNWDPKFVVNGGAMSMTGLEFEIKADHEQSRQNIVQCTSSPVLNKDDGPSPTSTAEFGSSEAVHEQIEGKTSDKCSDSDCIA